MPCPNCKERKSKQRSERQVLDAKLIALLGEVTGLVKESNPALAMKLVAIAGEVNALSVKERELG